MHGPLQSLRKLVDTKQPEMKEKERMTYAIASFPPEVQICESSIPGYCYGVCARHFIPVGTWIGPYEGVRVSAADFQQGMDTSYMWEVYYLIKTVWFHFIKKLPKFRLFRASRYVCKMFTVTRLVLVESTPFI